MRHRFKTGEYVHDDIREQMEAPFPENRPLAHGVLNFLVTSLVYAFILWFVTRSLENNDIIDGRLAWESASTIALSVQFGRIWDRAFMR
jgi:hypothetical protein